MATVLSIGVAATAQADTVTDVQHKLGVTADGIMGKETQRAVKRYQRAHGLVVDGVIGPQTLRSLGLAAKAASSKGSGTSAVLERIAECESGGDPTAVSDDGQYRGKYQFSRSTWRVMGGKGDPAKASEAEQDRRARALYRAEGAKPWPVCG